MVSLQVDFNQTFSFLFLSLKLLIIFTLSSVGALPDVEPVPPVAPSPLIRGCRLHMTYDPGFSRILIIWEMLDKGRTGAAGERVTF